MGNRERKIIRAEHNDPINFTCGVCRRVHPFGDGGYDCIISLCVNKTDNEIEEEEKEDGIQTG